MIILISNGDNINDNINDGINENVNDDIHSFSEGKDNVKGVVSWESGNDIRELRDKWR